ncbi:hypothetical protein Afil01_12450 [Actinorhabdospora filicis]|uniref:Uncharacterized protein n=1 Tax=Actinorhabdospora filicis TaxID=1785913 RepID=A0A9W6SI60_9ACTN|nr:hypothetical protein [Actinorhabdospora filicis]GLZ76438.1 hypothetical protein Afil01_12450 [Actinorhabdospora filicis]
MTVISVPIEDLKEIRTRLTRAIELLDKNEFWSFKKVVELRGRGAFSEALFNFHDRHYEGHVRVNKAAKNLKEAIDATVEQFTKADDQFGDRLRVAQGTMTEAEFDKKYPGPPKPHLPSADLPDPKRPLPANDAGRPRPKMEI